MTDRPFRFGIQLSGARSGKEWREAARRAEALGYDVLLMPDHFGDQFSPFPALAVAAAATTTLRLGALVAGNGFRHPLALAKEAVTLDLLSDGRFELGIGAGWDASDYTETGIPFDPAGVRVDRLAEALELIERALVRRALLVPRPPPPRQRVRGPAAPDTTPASAPAHRFGRAAPTRHRGAPGRHRRLRAATEP